MLIPVVLSGGAGTRLWPVSREGHPKPFIKLPDGETLLEKTYRRASACAGVKEVLTITNRDYYFQSRDCWSDCELPDVRARFLLEPFGRNTAPAILLAALLVREEHGEDAILLVLPADHLVKDVQAFASDVEIAQRLAKRGRLVTFGIRPCAPETGFGYIRTGRSIDSTGGQEVLGFVEKPNLARARELVASKDCFWNAGVFCFSAKAIIDAFARYQPELFTLAQECWDKSKGLKNEAYTDLNADSFKSLLDISIDYAIMEKAENVALVPASFDWSDIGSWNALADLSEPDAQGNRHIGKVVAFDSKNCFISSEDRVVAGVGLNDLLIVDTPDALLVSHRDKAQEVRQIVKQLKADGHESYKLPRTVRRPWGTYTTLEEGNRFKIKRIEVKPGAALSLQMHHHRSEHWIVVTGMARVTCGEKSFLLNSNESTFIPAGHTHRLANPGVIDLVMIEVQSGDYLGEDDIVRFEDTYGRL